MLLPVTYTLMLGDSLSVSRTTSSPNAGNAIDAPMPIARAIVCFRDVARRRRAPGARQRT
ncbi:MAG TPA: hypothetical protein VKV24_06575 [Casimicrobiaceae bacterium]|nr:hypothetical protein [Casimicrobiaceae bacterium]